MLATCHTVVDVGGEYAPEKHRYDHHQRSFAATFPGRPTKLSSAGLVYLHFGRDVVARRLEEEKEKSQGAAGPTEVELVWRKLYEAFVEALDAHDNGIAAYDAAALAAAGIARRFSDGGFTLGALVGPAQPGLERGAARRPGPGPGRRGRALRRRQPAHRRRVRPRPRLLRRRLAARPRPGGRRLRRTPPATTPGAGRIMVFAGQSCPWKDHLYTLEERKKPRGPRRRAITRGTDASPRVLYVLYPESPAPDARWRVQCVPVARDSFESRKPLPDAWRGLRDAELDAAAALEPGGVFVHASGFIGGHRTFDGALQMARKALTI